MNGKRKNLKCSLNGRAIKLKAPGKVNLYLEVLGERPDGYHEMATVLQKISLCDELEVELAKGESTIFCDRTEIPTGEGSLLKNTIDLFKSKSDPALTGFSVILKKKIPIAAGLGGGSSDAAALLKAMNRLTGEPYDRGELASMGAELGCDVPFFLYDSIFALGTARGDVIEPIPSHPGFAMLLLKPPFGTSSGDIYSRLRRISLTKKGRVDKMLSAFSENPDPLGIVCENLRNDLQIVVLRDFPELEKAMITLKEAGSRGVLISGSGPTVFGLFPDEERRAAFCKVSKSDLVKEGWDLFAA